MKKTRNVLDRPQFHRLCKWLESQNQPIISTMPDLCQKASSELKLEVSLSALQDAKAITKVETIPTRTSSDPSTRKNRISILAGIVLRAVTALETDAGEEYISEQDRETLNILKNCGGL